MTISKGDAWLCASCTPANERLSDSLVAFAQILAHLAPSRRQAEAYRPVVLSTGCATHHNHNAAPQEGPNKQLKCTTWFTFYHQLTSSATPTQPTQVAITNKLATVATTALIPRQDAR